MIRTAHLPANCLIPRQLVGCNCFIRNVQQASRTEFIWSKDDAGNSTCGKRTLYYNNTSQRVVGTIFSIRPQPVSLNALLQLPCVYYGDTEFKHVKFTTQLDYIHRSIPTDGQGEVIF